MMIEPWLCLGGIEIANPCRTLSYLRNLGNACQPAAPPMDGCCPDWLPEGEDGPGAYSTPAADDAPWYDPGVPESADVLGVWIEEIRLGAAWSRSRAEGLSSTTLGRGRLGGREIVVVGWLYARTAAATAYGRAWLFEALAGGCEEECDLPDARVYLHCGCDAASPPERTLRRVGLVAFDPDIEPAFPRACGLKFEATLVAEVGSLFADPVTIADLDLWRPEDERVCNVCVPCPQETAVAPCDCGDRLPAPRVVETPDEASLWCEPTWQSRHTLTVPAPDWWRTGTLVVTVDAGRFPGEPARPGISNLRLRAWPKPPGVEDPAALVCVEPCLSIEVGCIPADGRLVIDGRAREATIECTGQVVPAWPWLSSGGGRLQWPDVSCSDLLVAVEADGWNTSPSAHLLVELVQVDRS